MASVLSLSRLSILLALASITGVSARTGPTIPRPDPYADPKHDPYNPMRYIATNSLTGIAVGES
jgi:hypothetical protein